MSSILVHLPCFVQLFGWDFIRGLTLFQPPEQQILGRLPPFERPGCRAIPLRFRFVFGQIGDDVGQNDIVSLPECAQFGLEFGDYIQHSVVAGLSAPIDFLRPVHIVLKPGPDLAVHKVAETNEADKEGQAKDEFRFEKWQVFGRHRGSLAHLPCTVNRTARALSYAKKEHLLHCFEGASVG